MTHAPHAPPADRCRPVTTHLLTRRGRTPHASCTIRSAIFSYTVICSKHSRVERQPGHRPLAATGAGRPPCHQLVLATSSLDDAWVNRGRSLLFIFVFNRYKLMDRHTLENKPQHTACTTLICGEPANEPPRFALPIRIARGRACAAIHSRLLLVFRRLACRSWTSPTCHRVRNNRPCVNLIT